MRRSQNRHQVDRETVAAGGHLPYQVRATDTSGTITLRRDTPVAALKKAGELIGDGSWDVQIVAPDGHVYETDGFDALRADATVETH
jgi:hypothetical protein